MSDARFLSRSEVPSARVVLAWLLVAAWAAVVWWLGSDPFNAGNTSRFLMPLITWLWPDWPLDQRYELATMIRKLAHPTVYAVLAGLAFRAALLSGVSGLARGAAIALGIAVSLAGLDELRQGQSDVRTGAASDVVLDAAGASAALAALSYVRRRGRVTTAPGTPEGAG